MTKKIATPADEDFDFDYKDLNLYAASGRDIQAEKNGAWFKYEYKDKDGNLVIHPDIKFHIKSLGSEAGAEYFTLSAKYSKEAKNSKEDDSTLRALLDSGIIDNWSGVKLSDGRDVPFTHAKKVLTNLAFDYAAAFILSVAAAPLKFRDAEKEATLKN